MKETPQEYAKRILSCADGNAEPLKVLAATPGKLQRLVKKASLAKLRKRPAPEKWSAAEILAHLAESELVGGYRIRMILSANGTPIQAFDQNLWATTGNYTQRKPAASLSLFRVLRQANLSLLKSLTEEQWQQFGIHAERGQESIARMARLYAGHDLNHLAQIERIVAAPR